MFSEKPSLLILSLGIALVVGSVQSSELLKNEADLNSGLPSPAFSSPSLDFANLCLETEYSTTQIISLEQAMRDKSLYDIYQITGVCNEILLAPKPEKAEQYIHTPSSHKTPSKTQIHGYLVKYWNSIDDKFWWLDTATAENANTPIRAIAEVINGAIDSFHITHNHKEHDLAVKSAEALLKIQKEITTGGFGFPAWENNNSHLGKLTKKFLSHAKSKGIHKDVVKNGWIVDDLGRGDLYFDTGLAGEALLRVHQLTNKQRYLDAAIRAGDWALSKPIVPNFNYNAFSVLLLSKLYSQTKNKAYLDSAIEKALLGVFSGMLLKGENAGHWIDAHNERVVYRQIMLRATLSLLKEMPVNHPKYSTLQLQYTIAATAMFTQLSSNGITNPDSTMLSYCESIRSPISKPLPKWPLQLKVDLQRIALESLYKNKPFGGPAAVLCFLKNYSYQRSYLSKLE